MQLSATYKKLGIARFSCNDLKVKTTEYRREAIGRIEELVGRGESAWGGYLASLASTEETSNGDKKKIDWPAQKLVQKPPKLPIDGKRNLKNLLQEKQLVHSCKQWQSNLLILTRVNQC